jgi:hypothetical protein
MKTTHEWIKMDASTLHFPVSVKADGEVTLKYTIRRNW